MNNQPTHTSPKLCIFMLIFYCSLFSFQKLEMQIDGWLQSSRFHSILSDQIGFVHRIKAILFVRKMDKYRHELSRILWCWRNLCWIYSQIESQESITSELLHFMYTLAAPLFKRCCIKCFFRIQPKVIKSITIENHTFLLSSARNDEYSIGRNSISLSLFLCVNIYIFRIDVSHDNSWIKASTSHNSNINIHQQLNHCHRHVCCIWLAHLPSSIYAIQIDSWLRFDLI